jgi:hypothetical protein
MKTMQALFRLARTLTLALVLLPASLAVAGEATFTNPLNDSGPDPWMTWYEGHYYLAATTWGEADVGLTMRKARTIEELKNAEPVQIWQDDTADRCCNFWAPEFFLLDGPNGPRWYGYFTGGASGTDFVQTQFMHVIESAGTDPMGPYSYKGKLVERNALDGSVLQLNGKLYAIYSVWNETQDLAIKEMSNPWTTVGEETTLARPELPWERQDGTVLEGPGGAAARRQDLHRLRRQRLLGPQLQAGHADLAGRRPAAGRILGQEPRTAVPARGRARRLRPRAQHLLQVARRHGGLDGLPRQRP